MDNINKCSQILLINNTSADSRAKHVRDVYAVKNDNRNITNNTMPFSFICYVKI